MHPVLVKLAPAVKAIRDDNSQTLDVITMHPLDMAEIGIKPGGLLYGVPVIADTTRPRTSVTLGVTQERHAFDETKLGR